MGIFMNLMNWLINITVFKWILNYKWFWRAVLNRWIQFLFKIRRCWCLFVRFIGKWAVMSQNDANMTPVWQGLAGGFSDVQIGANFIVLSVDWRRLRPFDAPISSTFCDESDGGCCGRLHPMTASTDGWAGGRRWLWRRSRAACHGLSSDAEKTTATSAATIAAVALLLQTPSPVNQRPFHRFISIESAGKGQWSAAVTLEWHGRDTAPPADQHGRNHFREPQLAKNTTNGDWLNASNQSLATNWIMQMRGMEWRGAGRGGGGRLRWIGQVILNQLRSSVNVNWPPAAGERRCCDNIYRMSRPYFICKWAQRGFNEWP